MSLLVKICGLSETAHVQVAMEAGADALGFVFAASPRQVTPEHARTISEDVSSRVKRVAVMLHPSNEEWLRVLKLFSPDILQTDVQDFDSLDVPMSVECWPVHREGGPQPTGGTFVYEGPKSGQGETVEWSTAATLAKNGRMILAGGLGPGNIAAAIETVQPFGIDVSSGVESAPGQKDPDLIREFVSAARAAEKEL